MGFLEQLLHEEEPTVSAHLFGAVLRAYIKTNEPGWTRTTAISSQAVKDAFGLTGAEAASLQGLLNDINAGTLTAEDVEDILIMRLEDVPATGQPGISRQFTLDFLGL